MTSGEPVVNTLACFIYIRTRGCGCTWHPAFPAPSFLLKAREILGKTRARGVVRSWRCVYSSPLLQRALRALWGGVGGGGASTNSIHESTRRHPPPPTPPRHALRARVGREKKALRTSR